MEKKKTETILVQHGHEPRPFVDLPLANPLTEMETIATDKDTAYVFKKSVGEWADEIRQALAPCVHTGDDIDKKCPRCGCRILKGEPV